MSVRTARPKRPRRKRLARWITRRRRWLARRATRGYVRPRPYVVRVVNADSVTAGPRHVTKVWEAALTKPGRWGVPDLVLACEMADVNAGRLAKGLTKSLDSAASWTVNQFGPIGSPDSALAVAVTSGRTTLEDVELVPGSPQTSEGGGIRARPILTGTAHIDAGTPHEWKLPIADGHAPPSRAERSRATYLKAFKRTAAQLRAGDLNVRRLLVRKLFPLRRIHTTGVLHTVVARWIPSKAATVDVGSGHSAKDVLLWP